MPDWDARYAGPEPQFGDAPNEYVRRMATHPDFPCGSALCLADGDGRNSTWLATRGMAVTAVDISAVGTEKARLRDRAAGVSVERIVADVMDWDPGEGRRWRSVFLIYLQAEWPVRRRALRLAADALETDGWLVLEGFAHTSGCRAGPGPKDREVLYERSRVEQAVRDLQVLETLEGRVVLDEGVRHRGDAHIVRFTARKPALA